tara:strand:+ start:1756 stop:2379 length:624 start_codon:yes stop_codon:yes gene_type:complete
MNLVDLADNTRTDKNTVHHYLPVYDDLLARIKDTALNVLEVGICFGGSIKLWHDYFLNATIHGIDCQLYEFVWDELKDKERIKLYTSSALNVTKVDAYEPEWVKKTFGGMEFDFMLDDGPHTFESQVAFLDLYLPLLARGGMLIIEDIADFSYLAKFKALVEEQERCTSNGYSVRMYDMRKVKCRYDDIIFVVSRSHQPPVETINIK